MNFLRVLCVLCGLVIHGFALDREAFTFINYDLGISIEPEQQRLAARGKITFRNDSNTPQKNLSLQISSSLGWRSIQFEGKPVQFVSQPYTSDIDHTGAVSEAIVTLPREVPPKGSVDLEIGYEGTIPLDATRLTRVGMPEKKAKHMDWDQIGKSFTAVRGAGYVVWYPVAMESANLSEGNSLFETLGRWKKREAQSEMKIKFTHSGEGTLSLLLCNGKSGTGGYEQINRVNAVTTECRYWPLSMTVPLFVIGGYDGLDKPPINISYLPDHKSGAENYALAVQLAAPLVSEWFGASKGTAEVRAEVVDLADPEAAPYESGTMLLMPLQSTDSRLYQLGAVHQLTHAAFPSPRPWIYEGLAHFAQALYREQQSGRNAALDFMELHRAALADAEKALSQRNADGPADQSLLNTSIEEFYRSKAMYVWWMLRDMVGEEPLKKALATYRPEQDKEPSYLQHLIEAQAKKDLQWFFDDWVYHDRSVPDFRVESAYSRTATNGIQLVIVSVENLGNAGAEVPVTLRMKEGSVTKRLEVRARSKVVIRMEAISAPEEIVVNDGSVPESDRSNNASKVVVPAK
jgi:hypothetical protein